MGSYIPSTEAQRKQMLREIGLEDFRGLYKDVPEKMYRKRCIWTESWTSRRG